MELSDQFMTGSTSDFNKNKIRMALCLSAMAGKIKGQYLYSATSTCSLPESCFNSSWFTCAAHTFYTTNSNFSCQNMNPYQKK
jgi:hypothetical protein